MLAYCPTEYVGELFEVNVSCDGDKQSYFFVVWGTTNVTERKHFMYTVPGPMRICDCTMQQSSTVQYLELFISTQLIAQHLRLAL